MEESAAAASLDLTAATEAIREAVEDLRAEAAAEKIRARDEAAKAQEREAALRALLEEAKHAVERHAAAEVRASQREAAEPAAAPRELPPGPKSGAPTPSEKREVSPFVAEAPARGCARCASRERIDWGDASTLAWPEEGHAVVLQQLQHMHRTLLSRLPEPSAADHPQAAYRGSPRRRRRGRRLASPREDTSGDLGILGPRSPVPRARGFVPDREQSAPPFADAMYGTEAMLRRPASAGVRSGPGFEPPAARPGSAQPACVRPGRQPVARLEAAPPHPREVILQDVVVHRRVSSPTRSYGTQTERRGLDETLPREPPRLREPLRETQRCEPARDRKPERRADRAGCGAEARRCSRRWSRRRCPRR